MHRTVLLVVVALGVVLPVRAAEPAPRVPWTASRVKGSPEPPHPYRVERAFPQLSFKNPLLLVTAPGSDRLFVGEQAGKLLSFPNNPDCAKADLFLNLATELTSWDKAGPVKGVEAVYALVFHPKFAQNRYCYICYVLESKKSGEQLPDGTRVSRFTVTATDPPRCDPASEKVIITWLAGGHNGCDLQFGNDGMLYISTGDGTGPNPPDGLDTGQDLSDLLSSILRIDVDRTEGGKNYAVPPDNPFLKTPGVRPEIWSYGFRNPWRMSFDRVTGDLWVGDVGWEKWEMVYRIQRGGNYGWSVTEGPQVVRPEGKRGPTPILPPALALPHTESASITGGYVYRGKKFPDLVGKYVFGDWVTRKFWATRFDGDKVASHQEIAQGGQRVIAFCPTPDDDLLILHHDDPGTIHRFAPNPAARATRPPFPTRLGETGLFTSVKDQTPAPGVYPFAINAAPWADHATAERFVALPDASTTKMYDRPIPIPGGFFSGAVYVPTDGVLVKTISREAERGNPATRRRLETQLLHFDGEQWRGYSYRWNDAGTDAELVPAAGARAEWTVNDPKAPGGKRREAWHFPSRTECLTCHNPWAGAALSFTLPQLNKGDQIRDLERLGLIALAQADATRRARPPLPAKLTDPWDAHAGLDARARSYLHANCAHCHQPGAGGTAEIDLRVGARLEDKAIEVRPVQGTFEIHGAHILSPGDPYRSVLYYRMAKLGPGRMPHVGSEVVDERGVQLIRDWIRQLPPRKDDRALLDKVRGAKPADRAAAAARLLASTSGALLLAEELGENRIPEAARRQVLDAVKARPESVIRDLFERFLPDEERVRRLGSFIKPEQILGLQGDATRGKELFFKSSGLQCASCHRVAGGGGNLGPDLSKIADKFDRAALLESILDPSKKVEPAYVTHLVETTDGQVYTGLLAAKTDKEVILKMVGDKEARLPPAKIQTLVPQLKSLMPELLLRDLTAQQAADLLAYLASLK